ncbi:protein phosphatase 2C-like domain-containing protein 1 [Choloepus didactylus]|uniref:protein phosphatase 2C-like domain-containing protein 1 n=1 Tax=Choloepus didactylus TaxID=27675 RepID=UPI00189D1187|nr:protein phosphatase 2C-like domain-containing protein 1 [Choloepus didactylus]
MGSSTFKSAGSHHCHHHPPPRTSTTAIIASSQAEGAEAGEMEKEEGKEGGREQSEGSMEFNTTLKVFWKSRKWNIKQSTKDSFRGTPFLWKRNYFRKKRKQLIDSENYDDLQDFEKMITFPCSICKCEIDPHSFFLHKKRHVALATLGVNWMGGKIPQRSTIIVQRQFLITKLLSSFAFNEKTLQSINNAFELLWKKQVPAYYKIIDNIHRSSMYSQKISHALIKGVAICEDRNSTWRAEMDDKFTVVNNFGNKPNVSFFGLFDGHYGASAADLASVELPVLLLHQLSKFDPSYQMTPEEQKIIDTFQTVFKKEYTIMEDFFTSKSKMTKALRFDYVGIHKAFAKAFWRMDRLLRLGRKEMSRVQWSGCSALACILENHTKNFYDTKNQRRTRDQNGSTENSTSKTTRQIISGVLHVANTGNVQAVLCRNGMDFRLTKEHTTQNLIERKRVLKNGAIISSNESNGLFLEGELKITRGLGFHGNPKLKKLVIPAPQTISVPIDDLCQFLILATNGLWDVLDNKEVISLAMTMFHLYKETYCSIMQNKSSPSTGPPIFPLSEEPSNTKSETDIHVLFQYKPRSEECLSALNSKENLSDSKFFEHSIFNSVETFPPEMSKQDPCSTKETDGPFTADGMPTESSEKEKESCNKNFYEGAAEYVSQELVNAALAAGSRDNITVMVILLNGSKYQFLT